MLVNATRQQTEISLKEALDEISKNLADIFNNKMPEINFAPGYEPDFDRHKNNSESNQDPSTYSKGELKSELLSTLYQEALAGKVENHKILAQVEFLSLLSNVIQQSVTYLLDRNVIAACSNSASPSKHNEFTTNYIFGDDNKLIQATLHLQLADLINIRYYLINFSLSFNREDKTNPCNVTYETRVKDDDEALYNKGCISDSKLSDCNLQLGSRSVLDATEIAKAFGTVKCLVADLRRFITDTSVLNGDQDLKGELAQQRASLQHTNLIAQCSSILGPLFFNGKGALTKANIEAVFMLVTTPTVYANAMTDLYQTKNISDSFRNAVANDFITQLQDALTKKIPSPADHNASVHEKIEEYFNEFYMCNTQSTEDINKILIQYLDLTQADQYYESWQNLQKNIQIITEQFNRALDNLPQYIESLEEPCQTNKTIEIIKQIISSCLGLSTQQKEKLEILNTQENTDENLYSICCDAYLYKNELLRLQLMIEISDSKATLLPTITNFNPTAYLITEKKHMHSLPIELAMIFNFKAKTKQLFEMQLKILQVGVRTLGAEEVINKEDNKKLLWQCMINSDSHHINSRQWCKELVEYYLQQNNLTCHLEYLKPELVRALVEFNTLYLEKNSSDVTTIAQKVASDLSMSITFKNNSLEYLITLLHKIVETGELELDIIPDIKNEYLKRTFGDGVKIERTVASGAFEGLLKVAGKTLTTEDREMVNLYLLNKDQGEKIDADHTNLERKIELSAATLTNQVFNPPATNSAIFTPKLRCTMTIKPDSLAVLCL